MIEDRGEQEIESVDHLDEGYAFIGAVHSLVAAKNSATKADLLLAAACQALRAGDKSFPEILEVVDGIWPGARTDLDSIKVAVDLGVEIGLVAETAALGEWALWTLTTRGVEDVDRQSKWVGELRVRARDELTLRARRDFGLEPATGAGELWLEHLVRALIEGIQASQDAYFGRVDERVGSRLAPRGIDRRKVFDALQDDRIDPVTADLLRSAAEAVFDPLDPFGNELISLITTGCVLHSYVAGRDSAKTHAQLGTQRGQRALVDTPVLVDLVGPARVSDRALFILQAAVRAGWEVIVCEHSLDELTGLLEREIPRIQASFTEAHSKGVRTEWYASLVDSQIATYCVEVLRDGKYNRLDQIVNAAHNLREFLEEHGIEVRPHHNEGDVDRLDRARAALRDELERSGSGRSNAAVERDAQSICVVWRRRRRQSGGTWPGGWIITTDRHIAPAYAALERHDRVPLTLTLARWGTLLSTTVAPAEVVELASAAATQLLEEAMWLLPARIPSEVAMSLARQLSPAEGGSESDLRLAQLTLYESLDSRSVERSANDLASEILAARAKRTDTLQEQRIRGAAELQERAERTAAEANARAVAESEIASSERQRASSASGEVESLRADLAWEKRRARRLAVVVGVSVMAVLVAVAVWFVDTPLFTRLAVALAAVILLAGGFRWVSRQDARLSGVLIGAAVEVIGLASGLLDLFGEATK